MKVVVEAHDADSRMSWIEDFDLKLKNDMHCVNDWCNNNHMVGNSDKTNATLIATYQKNLSSLKKRIYRFFPQHTTEESEF